MSRSLALAALVVSLTGMGCTPTLFMNRSFLVPEELKLSQTGFASLKSTGETFNLTPLKAQEPAMGDRIQVLEVHGTYVLVGEGWKHAWRVWPASKDEAKYKALDLAPGGPGSSFTSPSLEASGNCALLKWNKTAGQGQAFITADGDFNATKCGE